MKKLKLSQIAPETFSTKICNWRGQYLFYIYCNIFFGIELKKLLRFLWEPSVSAFNVWINSDSNDILNQWSILKILYSVYDAAYDKIDWMYMYLFSLKCKNSRYMYFEPHSIYE